MDHKINDILKTIDFYCELIENPEVLKKMDLEYMRKTFQACMFIETAIAKIQNEKKETDFESHLNAWLLKKKKSIVYNCSNLKNACDKMLEFCLKREEISNEIIDELLKLYIHHCGSVRLESNIDRILINSMQANNILKIFKNSYFSESDIEDEILIASWEHEIKIGKRKIVKNYLTDMFNKECITRLIELAYKSVTNSAVNSLILEFFTKKLIDNHVLLYSSLKNTNKKILLKLLMDNNRFQESFIDATFYIGRNMEEDDEQEWITDTGFSYNDLKAIILILLDGPEELYKLTIDRIKLAKELDVVWKNIEKDCIL